MSSQTNTRATKSTRNTTKTKLWLVELDFGMPWLRIPAKTKEEAIKYCHDRGIGIYTSPIKSIKETDIVKIGDK